MDYISVLPENILVYIIKLVPHQKDLFIVCKSFYNATCIAFESNYKLSLHGNSEIRKYYNSIVGSKRIFRDFTINEINSQELSKNDVKKLLAIFEKFGENVTDIWIGFKVITEKDVCHMLSFFPKTESISIYREYSKEAPVPKDIFGDKNQSLIFSSLCSIIFSCKTLDFGKIFDNFQLTEKFKILYVTVADPTVCFKFLKQHSSIKDLSITSAQSVESIPLDHLKLQSLILSIPNSKQLLPLLDLQTELKNLDLNSDHDSDYEDEDDSFSSNDSNYEHSSSSDENKRGDVDVLKRAATMNSLDFTHFMKLSNLKQLSVTSKKLDKITIFSSISMLNVTRLLLTFKEVRVPNNVFNRIAINFSNVNDLIYEGGCFCDAFICFATNWKSLEKFHIMRSVDFVHDQEHYVPSSGAHTKVNTSLKSVTLYFSFPNERNVHLFVIRLALIAPNIESLYIETDSMKLVQNNFIYILRNFKNLKNIKLSYDLYPDELQTALFMRSMENVVAFAKKNELEVIKILKEYGTHLDYVEMYLSTPQDLQDSIWRKSFCHQFPSIKIDDDSVTMKKIPTLDEWKLFA